MAKVCHKRIGIFQQAQPGNSLQEFLPVWSAADKLQEQAAGETPAEGRTEKIRHGNAFDSKGPVRIEQVLEAVDIRNPVPDSGEALDGRTCHPRMNALGRSLAEVPPDDALDLNPQERLLLTEPRWHVPGEKSRWQAAMSRYQGEGLSRERLDELAGLMDLGPEEVEAAVLAACVQHPEPPAGSSPVEPTPEEHGVLARAAARAWLEAYSELRNELRRTKADQALKDGQRRWLQLKPFAGDDLRELLQAPVYDQWGLAVNW
jgi:hypothetical protein